jgi:hypothetical protein
MQTLFKFHLRRAPSHEFKNFSPNSVETSVTLSRTETISQRDTRSNALGRRKNRGAVWRRRCERAQKLLIVFDRYARDSLRYVDDFTAHRDGGFVCGPAALRSFPTKTTPKRNPFIPGGRPNGSSKSNAGHTARPDRRRRLDVTPARPGAE